MDDSVIAKVDKKKLKLGVHWKDTWINFCSLSFTGDNSFYFSSKFHNQGSLEFGPANLKKGRLLNQKPDQFHRLESGFHVSLHPKGQLIHAQDNRTKKILFRRKVDWFPVRQPFNLLLLYSPPLDCCQPEKDRADFCTEIPVGYRDSIQIRVDIFPRDIAKHHPYKDSIWIFWGKCPEYLVRVSMNLIKQRTPILLYWPADDKLCL